MENKIIISDLEKMFSEMSENRVKKIGYVLLPEISGLRGFAFDGEELYQVMNDAYTTGRLTQPKAKTKKNGKIKLSNVPLFGQ